MMMNDQQLDDLFSLANAEIKKTEYVQGDIVVPALNELRNASEHRARAQVATTPDEKRSQMQRAASHYMRAAYDAVEVRILFRLDAFRTFQKDFARFAKTRDIPIYVEAVKAAQNAQASLLSFSQSDQKPDLNQLNQIDSDLESHLSSLLQNRAYLEQSVSKARSKWRKHIYISLIGFLVSILASAVTMFLPAPHKQSGEVQEQIANLDSIQTSLAQLQGYVSKQKGTLTDLNRNVIDLKSEKAELEKIVQSGADTVDTILRRYDKTQRASRWKDIVISFLVGVFSSLTVALIFEYRRRTRETPSFDGVQNALKRNKDGSNN